MGADPNITYKRSSLLVINAYWTATSNGAGRWNAVAAPGTFIATTSGAALITMSEASFVDPTIWAITQGSCPKPRWPADIWNNNSVSIVWSTTGAASLTSTQLRMVATHELGHALGLAHIQTTCAGIETVMVQGDTKWSCGWGLEPWQNDIDNVNWVY